MWQNSTTGDVPKTFPTTQLSPSLRCAPLVINHVRPFRHFVRWRGGYQNPLAKPRMVTDLRSVFGALTIYGRYVCIFSCWYCVWLCVRWLLRFRVYHSVEWIGCSERMVGVSVLVDPVCVPEFPGAVYWNGVGSIRFEQASGKKNKAACIEKKRHNCTDMNCS